MEELNEREKRILHAIIDTYIVSAAPVGSAQISRIPEIGLKPASVRRIMAGLEEKGYITHPHTSAGRIPTTRGYRFYVDRLIRVRRLRSKTAGLILETIDTFDGDINRLMGNISDVLARISRQLGIIVTPNLYRGIFDRIQLVPVSTRRMMVILSVKDGPVNTITMEVDQKIDPDALKRTVDTINRRFHGKTLQYIRNTFGSTVRDLRQHSRGVVKLFIEAAERLLDVNRYENYQVTGASNILHQPEFSDVRRFSTLIELLEDRNIVIHFMEQREFPPGTKITIGQEHAEKQIQHCSVITSTYKIGDIAGVLGIIGPMRMAYSRVIPLVEFTAHALTRRLSAM